MQTFHGIAFAEGSWVTNTIYLHYWSKEENTPGRNPSFSIEDLPTSI